MSTPSPSFLDYVRSGLKPSALGSAERVRQAAWMGAKPPFPAVVFLSSLKVLGGLLVAAAFVAVCPPLLDRARDVRAAYIHALDRALPRNGRSVADFGLTPAGESRRRHRATVEFLFSRETRATIQKRHDRWQSLFGDRAYRGALKPLAADRAARAYLGSFLSGQAGSPAAWARRLSPEELERMTLSAERDYLHALKFNASAPAFETAAWGNLNGDGSAGTFLFQRTSPDE